MTADRVTKTARTGTKSCTECRRRKIRCIWTTATTTETSCVACATHQRICIPQAIQHAKKPLRESMQSRIDLLEQDLSSLRNAVHNQKVNDGSASGPAPLGELSEQQPSHLKILFTGVGDGDENSKEQYSRPNDALTARRALQVLTPSIEEVIQVSQYASGWMSIYYTLFPASYAFRTGDQLVNFHTSIAEADPVMIAGWLLALAITAQQTPFTRLKGMDIPTYIGKVEQVVALNVINNTSLIMSPLGLEVAMLFIRLSFGRGNLRSSWLLLRRVISISEMMDLPHSKDPKGLAVWQAIYHTDRNLSMMLNLPPGLSRYTDRGNVSALADRRQLVQRYNYYLSNVCAMVFEIDEMYSHDAPAEASYEKVLSADRQLRELWKYAPDEGDLASLLVRFWHHYITARVHLRPTLIDSTIYAYSRAACLDACIVAVRLFPSFRLSVPAGFFICRILDLQVFTAASILQLIGQDYTDLDSPLEALIDCLQQITNTAGSDFAAKAIGALRVLGNLRNNHSRQDDPVQEETIQIPMLGKIHIKSKALANEGHIGGDLASSANLYNGFEDTQMWSFLFNDENWLTDLDLPMESALGLI